MSIMVMSHVWENAPVEAGSLLVLLALADHADDSGHCWPSVRRLAEKARLSRRHTQRVLRELETDGLIICEQGSGPFGANMYKVLRQGGDNLSRVSFEAAGDGARVAQTIK